MRQCTTSSYADAERFGELTGSTWSALAATSWADAYDGSGETAADWQRAETLRVGLVTGDYFQALGVRPRAGRALIGQDDSGAAAPSPSSSLLGQALRPIERRDRPRHPAERHAVHRRRHRPADFNGDWVGWPTDVWVPSSSAAAILPAADRDIRTRLHTGHRSTCGRCVSGARRPRPTRSIATCSATRSRCRASCAKAASSSCRPRAATRRSAPARCASLTILAVTVGLALLDRRQRRQPAAGAHGRPRSRAGRPHLARRHPPAAGAPAADEPAAHRRRAAAGLLLAAWGTDILAGLVRSAPVATIADGAPALELHVALDLRAVSFTAAVSMAAGLLFGLIPALRGSAVLLQPVLQRRNVVAPRLSRRAEPRTLVLVGQIAASTVLLIGTGLFIRSIRRAAGRTSRLRQAAGRPRLGAARADGTSRARSGALGLD